MSDRGLMLALQRLHDDPGFVDLVAQDPQATLGLYDMSDEERQALSQAVINRDGKTIDKMAENLGMDWTADHIPGAGALADDEVVTESQTTARGGQGGFSVSSGGSDLSDRPPVA
jgi:hypothetical protein